MFSKTRILTLAAIASIGAATLITSVSSADARPGLGGFRGGFKGGFGGRIARFTPDRLPHRPHWHPHRPHWHVMKWHRPFVYGVAATTAVAVPAYAAAAPRAAAAPAPGPCTCLTKEYTQDRLVVFTDRCTKETAAAPIDGSQQQGQAQPEAGQAEPLPPK
jgi:hypothetical protein